MSLLDKLYQESERRKTEGASVDTKESKLVGRVTVILYEQGAFRVDTEGKSIPIGNGNYTRMTENIEKLTGNKIDDPKLLIDIVDFILQDMVSGKLVYVSKDNPGTVDEPKIKKESTRVKEGDSDTKNDKKVARKKAV